MDIIKKFKVTCELSAAAEAFAINLSRYEDEHIRGVMSSKAALRAEVMWWHDYETSNLDDEDEDSEFVFKHEHVDPKVLADKVIQMFKGWKWRDVSEYGCEIRLKVPGEDVSSDVIVFGSSQRLRKPRPGELEIATILD